jgi:Rrf2 family nitric oxide-sensitive transcriptional repressor
VRISAFTDFSLRVLMYSAVHNDRLCTIDEIAAAFGISKNHLVKVVNRLQHLGYLRTHRGRTGGFRLAKGPHDIRLGDVVRQTEGSLAVVECLDPAPARCPLAPACGLKEVLQEAADAFIAVLDGHSLGDLLHDPPTTARVLAITPLTLRRPHA